MGGQSKILGWVIAGLVVVLAALTLIIVRSTAQPEPPDLTPVEVTPEPTESGGDPDGSGQQSNDRSNPDSSGSGSDSDSRSSGSDGSAGSSGSEAPDEIEHSYEPVPNPPSEVPDNGDDDDDDADDDDDGDDDDDADDHDDGDDDDD